MTTINSYNLPLYLFFEQLQKNNFAMDIAAYHQVLKALQGGFGLKDKADLCQLCKTVWLKPHHNQKVFDRLFKVYFEAERQVAIRWIALEKIEATPKDKPQTRPIEAEKPIIPTPERKETAAPPKENTTKEEAETEEQLESDELEYTTIQLSIGNQTSDKILDTEGSQSPKDFTFQFDVNPLPFSKRKLLLHWRDIQQAKSFRPTRQLDIEATVDSIPTQGKYIQPIFSKVQVQPKPTYLLIDQGGSMVAFEQMMVQLTQIIQREFAQTNVFYFYNVPQNHLFLNKSKTEGVTKAEFFQKCKAQRPNILIFSDAGAARNRYIAKRIEATKTFLETLNQKGATSVWINPMPKNRWKYNAALSIAAYTKMYELTITELQQAIQYIKNQP